ncbi:hypothetical protein APSETT445_007713 [Aspergillus pseudonomiae]
MSKLITVFGATGNQGGSVINHILADSRLSKEFKIRGITRDTSKPAAQELQKRGVEVVTADLNSVESLRTALDGSHTIFLVTNYWEYVDKDTEVTQGKNVADMLRKGDDGTYQLFYPVNGAKAKFPLFDAASDTGLFVKAVIKHASELNGKQVLEAAGYYTAEEIVKIFTEVTGKKAVFVSVSADQYKAVLPPPVAQEFLENHLLIESPGYFLGQSLDESLKLLDAEPTSFADFVKKNVDAWQ